MRVEIEGSERLASSGRVSLSKEQVGAEADQPSHGIGCALEHGSVEIVGRDMVEPGWAERTLDKTDCRRHLLGRAQILACDRR